MKPILFNTEMVQAILEGKKTVTRRCIKGLYPNAICIGWRTSSGNEDSYGTATFELDGQHIDCKSKYLIGDILYLIETWKIDSIAEHLNYNMLIDFKAIKAGYSHAEISVNFTQERFDKFKRYYQRNGWQSPYFMPKEAARLFLRVTDVHVERLSEMLGSDCVKEGIKTYTKDGVLKKYAVSEKWWDDYHRSHKNLFDGTPWQDMPTSIFKAFSFLWNSTVKKSELDQYGWNANPWVWVYEFEVISKEEAMKESEE